ncbi:Wzz/FepE/Etk N-terminal domain-containing protein [Parasediminibacterium paludis]|uniref:Wzz/FepE/Etk N-terminal domain-containing protein n=1 Tax=Parasediminibacterium paludis TaxID=908966 RepID=A0ABV8PYQ9_9BACT
MSSNQYSFNDFLKSLKFWYSIIQIKKLYIYSAVIIGFIIGFFYAFMAKPEYKAELLFANETSSENISNYSSIAAQFGLSLGGGGNAFEGDNLIELFKSRFLIEKTLLTKTSFDNGRTSVLFIDYYLLTKGMYEKWRKSNILMRSIFQNGWETPNRNRDSVLKMISASFLKNGLTVEKISKNSSMISASFVDDNELFAKMFLETLTQNAVNYYTNYKVSKAQQNLSVLKKQTDSLKIILSGNIENLAEQTDLNLNLTRQLPKINSQRRQIDLQASSAMYIEILKNMELAEINLRKATPFIQIIDTPKFPLENKKLGKIKTTLLGGLLAFLLVTSFFIGKEIVNRLFIQELDEK